MTMRNVGRAAAIAVVATLLVLLVVHVATAHRGAALVAAVAAGKQPAAPDFALDRLDGRGTLELSSLRGRVVVLNFWASWCKPCRAESPLLERWHRRMADRGGTVLGVDMLDVTDDAQAFIADYNLTYPMLKDGDGKGLEAFGVVQYPETFVIDRQGRIAAVRRGPVDEEFMQTTVEPLL
jgi:cytochrome c biogenesis protein CcmG/thiol:disulfide interchange protein DsbE